MSLPWTIMAGFLYTEIAIVLLLLSPISSRWLYKFFTSRFLQMLIIQLSYYFYIIVGLLIIAFLDATRETWKYSKVDEAEMLDIKMQNQLKMIRAQRNMYISGFAGFLCLVIRRLVALISKNAVLKQKIKSQ